MSALRRACLAVAVSLALTGCEDVDKQPGLMVAATTPILVDLARNVVGEQDTVLGLVPPGADPHSFEPSLRTVREIAYADIAFANGYLLEPESLMRTVEEVSSGPVVEVADHAAANGAVPIPMVENAALDAVWLGMRLEGADSAESIEFGEMNGPGEAFAYILSTFGVPQQIKESVDLPRNAHTHLSWGFTKPGLYEIEVSAPGIAPETIFVAVGVDPTVSGKDVIDSGHVDITANFHNKTMELRDGDEVFDPASTVIAVATTTLQEIPPDPAYRFLGTPGDEIYLLPQAVLGKHIHGEIDPHLWHNVENTIAYVDVIAEQVSNIEPSRAQEFLDRAEAYKRQLKGVHAKVHERLSGLPPHLLTTHHGYAYLDQGYGMDTAGYISPNPAIEPSPRDVIVLRRTLEDLEVNAVFVDANEQSGSNIMREISDSAGAQVCTLYGDSFGGDVDTYIGLMEHNSKEISRCLQPAE